MKTWSRRAAAVTAVGAIVTVGSATGAAAEDVVGKRIQIRLTSVWVPPSPDPSGIAYDPGAKQFVISDGEVEEMPIYTGKNLFLATTDGTLVGTEDTQPWSKEPTGIAVNPGNGEVYVSDDDQRSVFVLSSLSDDSPGVIAKAKFTATGVDPDLEGVAYDSKRNEVLLANGERGAGFFRVGPGADSQFGTSDDVVNPKILVPPATDTEGIAYDAVRDTVLLLDKPTDKVYEVDAAGTILNTIDLAGMGMRAPAGVEIAPASDGSGARHYYIVDRGVDNDSNPGENDGRIFEISATLPARGTTSPTNQAPTVNAGPDLTVTMPAAATLNGTASDPDGGPGPLTVKWTMVSGPAGGVAQFAKDTDIDTTATFTAAGAYVLKLTASDSALTREDTVTVTVAPSTGGGGGGGGGGGTTNTAPNVSVGVDRTISGLQLQLDATVTDDGRPAPFTVSWSKQSGPGTVTFANATAVDTTVTFSQTGVYELRLTADDSALTGHDELTVTVDDGAQEVAVNLAGPQRKLEFGRTARLGGTLEIDGATAGPGELVRLFVKRSKGAPFRFLANVVTADDGSFVYRDEPVRRTVYLARSNGEQSERVVVRVMPRLRAWVADATVGTRERTAIRGTVTPVLAGQRIRLQQWNGRRWRVVDTVVLRAGDRVRFSFPVRHRTAGTKVYRVVSPAYAGMARAVTPADGLRIQVRRR